MPDANSGMGGQGEGRQERRRAPRVPGASGQEERAVSPEEAESEARHRFGKTNKHVHEDE